MIGDDDAFDSVHCAHRFPGNIADDDRGGAIVDDLGIPSLLGAGLLQVHAFRMRNGLLLMITDADQYGVVPVRLEQREELAVVGITVPDLFRKFRAVGAMKMQRRVGFIEMKNHEVSLQIEAGGGIDHR